MRTWSSEAPSRLRLVGVGIDAEEADRFSALPVEDVGSAEGVMPHVFSPREQRLCASAEIPARAWAAAFTCKEALFKALGGPIEYREVELLDADQPLRAEVRSTQLTLSERLLVEHGLAQVSAELFLDVDGRTCVAVVHAFSAADLAAEQR